MSDAIGWEKIPPPTARDAERRRNVEKAISHIEQVALTPSENPTLTRSLAIVLLEALREASHAARDAEYTLTAVRAILKSLARDDEYLKDYLKGQRPVHRRGDEPAYPPKPPGEK